MVESRLLIAITPEKPVTDESLKIEALLSAGWHRVHLRHPKASREDMREILTHIHPEWLGKIVLHNHFDLTDEFAIGGLHLNHRCPTPPCTYSGALSRSCHSIDEILGSHGFSYVTLSPIFDSISKSGYMSAFTNESLKTLDSYKTPVIALGGVTPGHIAQLNDYNFSGYAMLGAIPWHENIEKIQDFAHEAVNQMKQ